jgi:hypothetical protein
MVLPVLQWRIVALGFTIVVLPHRFQAAQRRIRGVEGHGAASTGTNDNIQLLPVQFGLAMRTAAATCG